MAATDQADTTAAPAEAYDASDKAQVDRAKRDEGRRRKQRRDVLAQLLSKPAGRLWLWELLSAAHMFQQSYVPGDPYATAFRDGERNLGLRVLSEAMSVSADDFVLMLKENGGRG